MAISVVMRFTVPDALPIYDAIIDEMGVRDNSAPGGIYHWVAQTSDGLIIADVWASREEFDRFGNEKLRPLTAKHGVSPSSMEIAEVYKMYPGSGSSKKGVGVLVEADGDAKELLAKYDAANEKTGLPNKAPAGLIMHAMTSTPNGIRAIDHWQSREDFDRFAQSQLGPALQAVGMPPPRMEFFEVYNKIGRAHV